MAALQLGPLDNPDHIFRDDSYSSFDQSFIDQDSIFEEIDEENDMKCLNPVDYKLSGFIQ